MSVFKKIKYHDLREEASAGRLPAIIGRIAEIERLNRVVGRRINNNALVVGPNGIGKTALVYGWIRHMNRSTQYQSLAFLQLDIEHLYALDGDDASEEQYTEALASLPPCVLFIDDFGREVYRNAALVQRVCRLYKNVLKGQKVRLVLTLEPHEYAWLEREHSAFVRLFETTALKNQSAFEYTRILARVLPRLNERQRIIVSDESLRDVISYTERFPALGQLPQSAISLLDEAISCSASGKHPVLTQDAIASVVEAKTSVPKTRLAQGDLQGIKELEGNLNKCIINQQGAVRKIAMTLQRAKLGLRNPSRPLGSFLLLGPSGVGKTETAKCIAEMLFGRSESLIRFDMSEFQQDHTVQRLIGAPAGYVGYEEGGALTNALRREPHSLILLDEIEKAHPKVFDLFLQLLDDGRLTSGQNETVDARNAIIMATSNAGVTEILREYAEGKDGMDDGAFITEKVMPVLTNVFRLEFINRFDSIVLFKPLTIQALGQIAQLEITKIEKRLSKHHVRFEIEPIVIKNRITHLADPRFGARPVKRFIEETCEALLVQSLLNTPA